MALARFVVESIADYINGPAWDRRIVKDKSDNSRIPESEAKGPRDTNASKPMTV